MMCVFASVSEYKFSMYTPSMIAAASVAAALHGLDWTGKSGYSLAWLLNELTRITAIEQVRRRLGAFNALVIAPTAAPFSASAALGIYRDGGAKIPRSHLGSLGLAA